MGMRLVLRSFKGPSVDEFRRAFENQITGCGGGVFWGQERTKPTEDLRITHKGSVHTIYMPYLGGNEYLLCRLVGTALGVPWIELRIQEAAIWEYSLYSGGQNVDNFRTIPNYWDEDDVEAFEQCRGDAAVLSKLWGIPA